MSSEALIFAFPFVPLFALGAAITARALSGRDVTRVAIPASHALQLLVGAGLWLRFRGGAEPLAVPVSALPHAIGFAFDRSRLFFLAAYLVPLALSLFRLRRLDTYGLRIVFLFYLSGCSGLLVTGDVFNFFVFYEVMIMAAYVLIAARRLFFASVKYMLFNAISSLLLLAGIIVLYASGATFGMGYAPEAAGWERGNQVWLLALFTSAFLVKGAFFPVSGWVAGCHSATHGVISAFLGSFTIFTGMFGLVRLVLEPAAALGIEAPFVLLQFLSWVTLAAAAGFMFFETEWKRIVAGSTVLSMGLIGLLFSVGLREQALVYVAVHAIFKSGMFYLLDDVRVEGLEIRARRRALALTAGGVLFTVGAFPTAGYFLKAPLLDSHPACRALFLGILFVSASSFFKFRLLADRERLEGGGLSWSGPAVAVLLASVAFLSAGSRLRPSAMLIELAVLAAAAWCAPSMFGALRRWALVDRRFVFGNLNRELFYALVLLVAVLAFYTHGV